MATPIRQFHKPLALLLTLLLLCSWVCAEACSLRVLLKDGETPVTEISVELCQAAVLQDGSLVLTEEFSGLGLSPEQLSTGLPEYAEQAFQYVMARELSGSIAPTDSYGCAAFPQLEEGIWLVFERGGQAVAFPPYLITLPTEQNGQLLQHVNSRPKLVTTDSFSLMVMVLWEDDDDAAGKRPDFVEITLYRDGAPFRKVTLDADCQWQYTFTRLPEEGEYTAEQSSVRHYDTVCEEVAEGFLFINTYEGGGRPGPGPGPSPEDPVPPLPSEPPAEPEPSAPAEPSPVLPQTGHLLWPVFLLLSLGTVLVLFGLAKICLGGKEE